MHVRCTVITGENRFFFFAVLRGLVVLRTQSKRLFGGFLGEAKDKIYNNELYKINTYMYKMLFSQVIHYNTFKNGYYSVRNTTKPGNTTKKRFYYDKKIILWEYLMKVQYC